MNFPDNPQTDVTYLQQDVINFLQSIIGLMNQTSGVLTCDLEVQKYQRFETEIREAKDNVTNLELKMAIVAPMKAGKSTIVNAIAGIDILPSRNAAMTTIPTEIIFNEKIEQPKLTLNAEIRSVFQETLLNLKNKIQHLGSEGTQEKIEKYPHLFDLAENIKAGNWGFLTSANISGREQVIKALMDLNDIVRLCSLLDPQSDPLGQLTTVPRIETPFWRASQNNHSKELGNLVIIDTPGPNEAGENLRLTAVVEQQLRKCSIVLIVLDYTQLKTQAAEQVKQDVQKVINLRGKENLYALVNKIDQRRKGDMSTSDVQQFVAAEFDIGDKEDTGRVFEIAARRSFVAANFLQELKTNLAEGPQQMETASALAQEVFGVDWEEDLEEATREELEKKAQKLWTKSGFELFLSQAIAALMATAAPKTMGSALKLSRNQLVELRDDLKLRCSAIAQDEEKLKAEVRSLESDLKSLDECRTTLQEVDKIKAHLKQELDRILKYLQETAKVSLEEYFLQEEYESGNLLSKANIGVREFIVNLPDLPFFLKTISETIKSKIEYKPSGVFEFNTEIEAQDFSDQAVAYGKKKADMLLANVRISAGEIIEKKRLNLTELLDEKTQPIIERARKRLNQTFDLDLSLPQPSLTNDEIDVIKPRIETETREIYQGYEWKTVKKRSWTHWLWFVPYEEKIFVKKPTKKENYYVVSLPELIIKINQSIESGINSINQGINQYLDADFKQRVDTYFEALEKYLGNYRDNISQAQEDQNLSLEEKQTLSAQLKDLVEKAEKSKKDAEKYLSRTEQLLK